MAGWRSLKVLCLTRERRLDVVYLGWVTTEITRVHEYFGGGLLVLPLRLTFSIRRRLGRWDSCLLAKHHLLLEQDILILLHHLVEYLLRILRQSHGRERT